MIEKSDGFEIFDFRKSFERKKSIEKKVSGFFFGSFYFLVISHAQPVQAASRNSPCAAHKRGKRTPENPEMPKIPKVAAFWVTREISGFHGFW